MTTSYTTTKLSQGHYGPYSTYSRFFVAFLPALALRRFVFRRPTKSAGLSWVKSRTFLRGSYVSPCSADCHRTPRAPRLAPPDPGPAGGGGAADFQRRDARMDARSRDRPPMLHRG